MSDEHQDEPAPRKLTSAERLTRVEKALTDGLRIDLDLYDEAAINAERAAWSEESGNREAEDARTAELLAAEEEAKRLADAADEPAPAGTPDGQ